MSVSGDTVILSSDNRSEGRFCGEGNGERQKIERIRWQGSDVVEADQASF